MMTMTPARSVRYTLLAIALIATTGCSSPYPAPPDTRKDPVVDVIHGVEFKDDYRWLEDQGAPETGSGSQRRMITPKLSWESRRYGSEFARASAS